MLKKTSDKTLQQAPSNIITQIHSAMRPGEKTN